MLVKKWICFFSSFVIDAAVMPPFKIGSDPRNDWIRWKRAFDRFMKANDIVDDDEKYNLLLVVGGLELQGYYDKICKWHVVTSPEEGSDERIALKYESAIVSLDKYFAPQLNKRFERHLFRAMKQDGQESFEEYVFRLKDQANRCIFTEIDDMIIDQVIEGCKSSELRKKLLTDETTLNGALTLGKTLEEVQKQSKEYEKPSTSYSDSVLVQRITGKAPEKNGSTDSSRRCYNCNKTGHLAKDTEKCPARFFECHGCGSKGHFKVCCRKRKWNETGTQRYTPAKRVHAITSEKVGDGKDVFFVHAHTGMEEILQLDVGGVLTKLLVDSGSPANIINNATFEHLKTEKAILLNERCPQQDEVKLKSYASDRNILFSKVFETEIKVPGEEQGIWAHILVAPGGQTNLLSKTTAFALGVLKIGYHINQLTSDSTEATVNPEFPKIPGVKLDIQIDHTVRPVVQVARRLPMAMEADVEEAIQDLLEKKIIERAEGPLSWVSPLVPVRKTDGRIRLCVDMRSANKAVQRENYPMPNIDAAMASITKVN